MLISPANKPRPTITDLRRPFWEGTKAGRLMLQCCARCRQQQVLPKPWCIECGSRDLPWRERRPTGTVCSTTISRSVAMNLAGWQAEPPVLMCLIDLDDGARMYAQVVGCAPEALHIGMRVTATFRAISEDAGIAVFTPLEEG